MEPEAPITPETLQRRIRNRLIEYLEWASSFDEQREYQRLAPISVPNEVFNQWEDWVPDPFRADDYLPSVFTPDEIEALARYHEAWLEVLNATPNPMPPLEETLLLPEWSRLRLAAEVTLAVLAQRGRLPED